MKWMCEFETADGLEARKIMDFTEPKPQPRLRMPLRRKVSFVLTENPEASRESTLRFREYELRDIDMVRATCRYEEINH